MTLNNGNRVIAKHKRDEFKETATPRVVSEDQLKVLEDAELVANEWVTATRMQHVLDKLTNPTERDMKRIPEVIKSMVEDVLREGSGEIVDNKLVRGAISKRAANMYKELIKSSLNAA